MAFKIALGYALLGGLWVLFSGWLLHRLVSDERLAELIEQVKGAIFVVTTAGLFGVALDRYFKAIRNSAQLLQEIEQRWQFALEGAGHGVWDWNAQTNEVFFSPRWKTMLGFEPQEIANEFSEWKSRVHPDDLPRVLELIRQHFEGLAPVYRSEHRVCRKDGTYLWILAQGKIVSRSPDGKPLRVLGTHSDISERKQAERLQVLSGEILGILNDSQALPNAMQTILAAIKRETGFDAVGIRLQKGEDYPYCASSGFSHSFLQAENSLVMQDCQGEICRDEKGNVNLECTCGLVISGQTNPSLPLFTPGGSAWTNDAQSQEDVPAPNDKRKNPRNRCIHEGFKSVALIPIRVGQKIIGLLQLSDHRGHCFTLETIRYFEGIAASFGVALARLREEQALRESESRFRALIEHAPDGIVLINHQDVMIFASPSARRMFNVGLDAPLVVDPKASTHPQDLPKVLAVLSELRRDPTLVITLQYRYKHANGPWLWIEGIFTNLIGVPGIDAIVINFRNINDRKQVEESLRESEARYRLVSENGSDVIWLYDLAANRFTYVSPSVQRFRGFTVEEVQQQTMREAIAPESYHLVADRLAARLAAFAAGNEAVRTQTVEVFQTRKDGTLVPTEVATTLVTDAHGRVTHLQGVSRDISERKRLENQLRQAQKLEAIGQLAGGVAHDFNNILSAMMMHLGLLLMNPDLNDSIRTVLKDLVADTERAAGLTRQLLMFSRRSVLLMKKLDLNDVVANLLKMLTRLIGEQVQLGFEGNKPLPLVNADEGMMEQVLLNLVVNARDAMPQGGRIKIGTAAVELQAEAVRENHGRLPGHYVCLTVQDTGGGMDPETLKHIFEPFFTTKEAGKGTGLGLATVHGIVAQHKGWVEVDSKLGQGTTFRIFLPAAAETLIHAVAVPESEPMRRGWETILLVEDDLKVRQGMGQALRMAGYQVIEAGNGQEALSLWQVHGAEVGLLLTDMVMPQGMTGLELIQKLQALKPGLKAIISSGYSVEMVQTGAPARPGVIYLSKPFEVKTLARVVRDLLNQKN